MLFMRRFGLARFLQEVYYRAENACYERLLNVDTSTSVTLSDLGIAGDGRRDYNPMGYKALYRAMRRVPLKKKECAFLDYGAGKGRALVVAATFPFRRVVGVEISDRLVECASQNLRRMRWRRAHSVEVCLADAVDYPVPHDVNVLYFFNPFRGRVLRAVVENIYQSWSQRPRTMYVAYFNNDDFEVAVGDKPWIRNIHRATVYPNYSFGMYEIGCSR